MKKVIPFFVVAFATCYHLMAQKAQIDWSDMDKKSVWAPYLASVVNGNGDELIALYIKTNELVGNTTAVVTRFDRHFNPVQEKKLFRGSRLRAGLHSLLKINGSLLVFTEDDETDGIAIKSKTLQVVAVNPATLEAGAMKELASFDCQHKQFTDYISVEPSANDSAVLVFAKTSYSKGEDNSYYMGVWDNKMNKQWERTISLPYTNKFTELSNRTISNAGDVYLLCRQYEKEVTRLPNGIVENTSPYTYKIFVYSKNDSLPREYTVDMKGKFVHQAILQFDNNGRMMLFGLYKNSFAGRICGGFSAMADQSTPKLVVTKMMPFPINILNAITVDGCGSYSGNWGLDLSFKIVGSDHRADGTIDLLAEYTAQTHHSSINAQGRRIEDQQPTHQAFDVMVTSFKKDGSIIYTHLPKKQEETPSATYISIRYMAHGNNLVVFYNDNKKNIEADLVKRHEPADSIGNSVFVMATINENGEVQRQVAFSDDDPEMVADLGLCRPVGNNALFLYVYKRQKLTKLKYRYGVLTLP